MKTIGLVPATLLLVLLPALLQAQSDTTPAKDSSTINKRKNVFTASANYQSRLHYFGRVDSLKSSGFFPVVEFQSKYGVYVSTAFVFLQNSVQSMDYTGSMVELGYRFKESKHFSGNISGNRFLYKDNSELVQSALKWQTAINLTWKNKIANVTGGGSARFSNQVDMVATGTLDHLFIFKIPHAQSFPLAIAVNPTATMNAGTQKFVESYNRQKNILGLPTGQLETVEHRTNSFNILSYEFSAPVVLVVSKFFAALTPSYILPQHLVVLKNNPALSERGEKLFYVTATLGVRI